MNLFFLLLAHRIFRCGQCNDCTRDWISASVIASDYITEARRFHVRAAGVELMADTESCVRGVCTVDSNKSLAEPAAKRRWIFLQLGCGPLTRVVDPYGCALWQVFGNLPWEQMFLQVREVQGEQHRRVWPICIYIYNYIYYSYHIYYIHYITIFLYMFHILPQKIRGWWLLRIPHSYFQLVFHSAFGRSTTIKSLWISTVIAEGYP